MIDKILINTEVIYSASNNPDIVTEQIVHSRCAICGKDICEGVKAKKVLSSNFTNWADCRNINGKYICKECSWCIKNDDLRRNNIVADSEHIYLLKKNDLEEYLFNLDKYVGQGFIIGITESFKKHNCFRCKVNYNTQNFYIRHEDKEYLFDTLKLKPLYNKLKTAYEYFSKDELQTGNYKYVNIDKFVNIDKLGEMQFIEYETLFKQYRGSAQFKLLVYMLNSERKRENIQLGYI